jgi:hypothetical protein
MLCDRLASPEEDGAVAAAVLASESGGGHCAVPDPAIVDYICGRVGVTKEAVEERVQSNACDDLCAMYHLLVQQAAEAEREAARAHTGEGPGAPAVVLSASPGPPLSPSSLSPFMQREAAVSVSATAAPRPPTPQRGASVAASSSPAGSGPPSPRIGPTEVYNDEVAFAGSLIAMEQQRRQQLEIERLLTLRRHTMGPGQTPMYLDPWEYEQHVNVLPQTDLTTNLLRVSNLPPESFSVKDPHLLKPPPALLGAFSNQHGRRASDGGAYCGQSGEGDHRGAMSAPVNFDPDTAPTSADASSHSSGDDNRSASPVPLDLTQATTYSMQVEQLLKGAGAAMGSLLSGSASKRCHPDSPRKRRTGLDTVMEPPEISPDLQREVETRMGGALRLMPPPAGSRSPSISPSPSPGGGTSLRQRRSGLSTVPEKVGGASSSSMYKDSLHLPTERYSPVRRLSDPPTSSAQIASQHRSHQSSLPVSSNPSPSDVRALQEEYTRLHLEATGGVAGTSLPSSASSESAKSAILPNQQTSGGGHLSPLFLLRPPSPSATNTSSTSLPRRLSDSGVGSPFTDLKSSAAFSATGGPRLRPSASVHSATSEPMQQLYDDMYNTDPTPPVFSAGPGCTSPGLTSGPSSSSRRFSYPNSPVHLHMARQAAQQNMLQQQQQALQQQQQHPPQNSSLTQYLQGLSLQPAQEEGGGPSRSRFKGSITQGVPGGRKSAPAAAAAARRIGGELTRGHSLKAQSNLATASSGAPPPSRTSGQFGSGLLAHTISVDEGAPPPGAPAWGRHHSVCAESFLAGETFKNPKICVTDASGDQVRLTGSPFGGQLQGQQHSCFVGQVVAPQSPHHDMMDESS